MPHPFDATLKDLGRENAADFLALFDQPTTDKVKPLNVDLSTVTAGADIVLGIGDPLREIIHIDFQAGPDADKGRDVAAYNILLHRHYRVPVHSVLVLLRPKAVLAAVNGEMAYAARPGRGRMDFGYEVVHLWEVPVERILAGPLGTLPLAVLGQLPAGVDQVAGLTDVVRRVLGRLLAEAGPGRIERLQVSMAELMGLLMKRNEVRNIIAGVNTILAPGHPFYDGMVDLGEEIQLKKSILKFGKRKLGEADEVVRARLEEIDDLERLDRIEDRVLDALSWDDLLSTP
ncbi:MAG: hypothetical protein K2W96_15125 [Gemmataceae bacterium]|nr:hypothetical protein [Gemmataceae bacterium]